jgi:hypothetical protein
MLILTAAIALVGLTAAASPAPPRSSASPPPSPAAPAGPSTAASAATRAKASAPVAEGTVRGPDGTPLAGALVIATLERTDFSPPPATTRTDQDGQFRLTLRAATPFTLRVEAPGLAARTLRDQQPGSPIAVALTRGSTIEGVVRETSGGTPVPGATVEARDEMRGAGGLPWDPDSGVVRATTDAKGAFRLEGLASGLYTLTAFARGLGRAERRSAPAGRAADLLLMPGGAVSGTVTKADGKPVDGAILRLTTTMPFARESVLVSRTDPHGTFAIYGVAAGEYRLVGRHPDLAPAVSAPLTVERDAEARADLAMSRPATVRGRLVGAGEKPTRGHAALKEIAGVGVPEILAADLTAEAGDDGVFALRAGPGTHTLEVSAPGHATRRLDVDVRSAGETVELGDVVVEVGIAIRGHVRDGANRPVENAEVSTFYDSQSFSERTDASGAYVLAGLSPGVYTVSARAPGTGGAERKAEAGASGIDFVLPPAGRITGLVVDDAGRPIEAFRANARARARMGYGGLRDNFAAPDGRFVLEDVAEGEYVLDVSAPDRAPAVVPGVKVTAGSTADVGTVRLSAGGIVRGLVVDAAAAPVTGASASISGAGRDYTRITPEVTSDTGGAFEFRGVPPGTAQVTVTHPGYAPGFATGLDVDPARGPTEVRVTLSQGGRIEGRVRTRSGVLPAGAVVDVRVIRQGIFGFGPGGPGLQPVAPDGTFVVDHVPTGRVTITLLSGKQDDYRSIAAVDAEVREAETSPVDFLLRSIVVTGKVTRGGTPLAGARVEFETAHGGMMISGGGGPGEPPANVGITGDDGSYQLTISEAGETYVNIQTSDRRGRLPAPPLQVPDTDSTVADFNFSGSFVEGVVVDRDTEQPIAGAMVTAQPKDPGRGRSAGSYGNADGEGRFHLELEPGEYRVNARAEGYGGDAVPVTVDGGSAGVRVVLIQGLTIRGSVVDPSGRGVGGVIIRGATMVTNNRFSTSGRTLPDGSFELSGLRPGRYVLAAVADGGLFAIVTGLLPGGRPATLALRPGGRVRVKVLGPDGAPAAGAFVGVSGYPGARVYLPGGQADSAGLIELNSPLGEVEITASNGDSSLEMRTTVVVQAAAVATTEMTLKPSVEGR